MGKRSCGGAPPECPGPCPQRRFRRTRLQSRRPVGPPVGSPPSRSLRQPSPGRRSSRGSSTLGASGPDPPLWRHCPATSVATMVDPDQMRSEEHTSELQSRLHLVCRLLLEKKKKKTAT